MIPYLQGPHLCRWGTRPRDTGAQRGLKSLEADDQATGAEPRRNLSASLRLGAKRRETQRQ